MKKFVTNIKFDVRKGDTDRMIAKYPGSIPIYVSKGVRSNNIEDYGSKKFMVKREMTGITLLQSVRNALKIKTNEAVYLMVNDIEMILLSLSIGNLYDKYKSDDGYMYVSYYGENAFGFEI
jgi:GABA(A) receptor-associated protein